MGAGEVETMEGDACWQEPGGMEGQAVCQEPSLRARRRGAWSLELQGALVLAGAEHQWLGKSSEGREGPRTLGWCCWPQGAKVSRVPFPPGT